MIKVIGPRDGRNHGCKQVINTTSRAGSPWSGLSPFLLGPVELYDGIVARNVENAWQFSKVYAKHVDPDTLEPNFEWWKWASAGWDDERAHRYPMGKGAVPAYSYWKGKDLGYIAARKRIYIPLYAKAVLKTESWKRLDQCYKVMKVTSPDGTLGLWDFDGYDHRAANFNLRNVVHCKERKMGHAFVLMMLLLCNGNYDRMMRRFVL